MICCDMRLLICTLYTNVCCNCAVSALDPSHRLHRRPQMAKVSSSQSQRGRLCGSCSGLCYRAAAQQLIAFKLACGVSCRFSSGQGQIYERQPQVWPVILELAPVQRNQIMSISSLTFLPAYSRACKLKQLQLCPHASEMHRPQITDLHAPICSTISAQKSTAQTSDAQSICFRCTSCSDCLMLC